MALKRNYCFGLSLSSDFKVLSENEAVFIRLATVPIPSIKASELSIASIAPATGNSLDKPGISAFVSVTRIKEHNKDGIWMVQCDQIPERTYSPAEKNLADFGIYKISKTSDLHRVERYKNLMSRFLSFE